MYYDFSYLMYFSIKIIVCNICMIWILGEILQLCKICKSQDLKLRAKTSNDLLRTVNSSLSKKFKTDTKDGSLQSQMKTINRSNEKTLILDALLKDNKVCLRFLMFHDYFVYPYHPNRNQ